MHDRIIIQKLLGTLVQTLEILSSIIRNSTEIIQIFKNITLLYTITILLKI